MGRLHPAAIVVWLAESLGRLVLGVVGLAAFEDLAWLVALALVAFTTAGAVVRYATFRYAFEGGAFVVQGGLLARWRRVIPIARIQNVDVVEKLRHRLFGVVELRVETAGGDQTEATLVALLPADAEALRERLLDRGLDTDDGSQPPIIARLGPADLVVAGMTGGRVAVIAVLLGWLQELAPERVVAGVLERVLERGAAGIPILLAGAAVFLAVSLVVSVIATVFAHWDFTLRREGTNLVVTRGLLERRRAVVPLRRLQAVKLEENAIRRILGLASLRAVTAGYSGGSEDQEQASVLLPVARRERAMEVAGAVSGTEVGGVAAGLEPAPRAALARRLLVAMPPAVIAGSVAAVGLRPLGALLLALLVPVAAVAHFAWRALGHQVTGSHAVTRSGFLVRRTSIARISNLQHLSVTVSPLQRLLGLATVRLHVPRARLHAEDLSIPRAAARFSALSAAMAGEPDGGNG